MRYCCRCGNALSVGASFCHCCGASLKSLVPETEEAAIPAAEPAVEAMAAPVVEAAAEPAVEAAPAAEQIAPVVISRHSDGEIKEEREFLEQTHRLLRWERKAMSISSKVALGVGIGFTVMFLLIGIIASVASGEWPFALLFSVYALEIGFILIPVGVIGLVASQKIPQYTDTLYKDFRAAHARCGSIGMIVFNYFFGGVGLVFFIINFVRIKCNKKLIDRILTRQGVK